MNILIADDEPLVRKGIISTLQELKSEFDISAVFECHNGAAAIERLKESPVDLVLTDILMPEVDGIELLRWIHDEGLSCRSIVLSCHDDYGYVRGAFQNNAVDYVLKYDIDEDTIRELLRQATGGPTPDIQFGDLASDQAPRFPRPRKLPSETLPTWIVRLELSGEPDDAAVQELSGVFGQPLPGHPASEYVVLSQAGPCLLLAYQQERDISTSEIVTAYRRILKRGAIPGISVVAVGISGTFVGSHRLEAGIRTAEESLAHRFFGRVGDVFAPEVGSRTIDAEKEAATLMEWKARFIRDLSTGEPALVAHWLDSFGRDARRQHFACEAVRRLLRDTVELFEVFLAERRERLEPAAKTELYTAIDGEPYLAQILAQLRTALVGYLSARQRPFRDSVTNTGILRALEIIHADYCSPGLSLSSVAESLHYSSSYLSRVFAKELGTPLVTYINNLRLDDARRLLREGGHYVYEVAELVGFSSYNYFSKLYSRRFGTSPGREHFDAPVEAPK